MIDGINKAYYTLTIVLIYCNYDTSVSIYINTKMKIKKQKLKFKNIIIFLIYICVHLPAPVSFIYYSNLFINLYIDIIYLYYIFIY